LPAGSGDHRHESVPTAIHNGLLSLSLAFSFLSPQFFRKFPNLFLAKAENILLILDLITWLPLIIGAGYGYSHLADESLPFVVHVAFVKGGPADVDLSIGCSGMGEENVQTYPASNKFQHCVSP
jgi:hypothetical protein